MGATHIPNGKRPSLLLLIDKQLQLTRLCTKCGFKISLEFQVDTSLEVIMENQNPRII